MMDLDLNLKENVLKRYLWANEDWQGLCNRVANYLARDDGEREAFFSVMKDCLFLPNTPALINAGRDGFSMSACFVLPVGDSMVEIFETAKNTALIHKMGGGTGFDFSSLRPAGSEVKSTGGVASGPCSFIHVFDVVTAVTKQGGVRRGANMGILRVDHPDILEFIDLKKDEGVLTNMNISIAITDSFMTALKSNSNYKLIFNGKVVGSLKAKEVWDKIIENAWSNGEPGVIFIDRMNQDNMTPHIGDISATNPCGEQPLLPYEACVLGSINLAKHLNTKNSSFDWEKLEKTVSTAVSMLDLTIDRQAYPLPESEKMHKGNRKIGIGVMGWADALIKLKLPYNSKNAVKLAELVMSFITKSAIAASECLAEKYGEFPNWKGSVWERNVKKKLRNATLTTIAPTGSISIIAGCSSGIEPVFDFETIQKRANGEFKVLHPLYAEWLDSGGNDRKLPEYFVTARDISVEWHIKMQAAFQKHTHNAVSKTVNLRSSATKQDVQSAFISAYDMGCKGVTVYRDGSRKEQVITSKVLRKASQLPDVMDAKRVMLDTLEGKVYFHISLTESKEPMEVFIDSPVNSKYAEILELFARMTSIALRHGCPIKKVISQLEKVQDAYGSVSSISGLLLRAFRKIGINNQDSETCPDCQDVLVMQEGCAKCRTCGFTRC